jgi:cell division protein FtsI/penicillin-binding protein 2
VGIIERRISLLSLVFLALLVLAGARTAWLGTVKGAGLRQAAATQQTQTENVPARRGTIDDRHGVDLAVSEPADDVSANPYLVRNPGKVSQRIAALLGRPVGDVLSDLVRPKTGFVYLARGLPADSAERIRAMNIAGIDLTPTSHRVYPRQSLASQVLGSVGTDGVGLSGLEWSQERVLRGQDGQRRIVKDGVGQPVSVRDPRPTIPGKSIQLTIDASIQDDVEDVLAQVGETYRPKGATAVVMDPRNGEILALGNWPRVDANNAGAAPDYAHQDRAVGFNYEPGSTFKAFTVAGALEDGVVTPDTSFSLPPQIQVADRTIGEAESRGWITLTTSKILAQSSNVGAIKIGQRLGRGRLGEERFDHWVRRFGFGRPTGVDLPGEERGQVLPVDQYSGSSMGNLPIGQGISVTPMQMARAYAAIANGGVLPHPHVLRRIGGQPVAEQPGARVISATSAAQLRTMLEGVFGAGGTASEVSIPGYILAGKTGTANKIDPTTGTYSQSKYVSSFVGFAPARDPKLLVSVMVDEPQGSIYGGKVAAPAFGDIMKFSLGYLGIPPQ